ncbi:hypothetical protein Tco_0993915 [Tanacetum coccineum]
MENSCRRRIKHFLLGAKDQGVSGLTRPHRELLFGEEIKLLSADKTGNTLLLKENEILLKLKSDGPFESAIVKKYLKLSELVSVFFLLEVPEPKSC